MINTLYISGVMPSKIFLSLNLCHHGRDPWIVDQACQSVVLRFFYSWISNIIPLQGVTSMTWRARDQSELRSGLALPRWEAIAQARHFWCPGHWASNFYCFFYFHTFYFHTINSLCLFRGAWSLELAACSFLFLFLFGRALAGLDLMKLTVP